MATIYQAALKRAITSDEQERLRRLAETSGTSQDAEQAGASGSLSGQNGSVQIQATGSGAMPKIVGPASSVNGTLPKIVGPASPTNGNTAGAANNADNYRGDWQDLWQAGSLVTGQPTGGADTSYANRGMTGYFKSSDGNIYNYETAPDDVLARHGLMRYEDGAVLLAPSANALGSTSGSYLDTMWHRDGSPEEIQQRQGQADQEDWARRQSISQRRGGGTPEQEALYEYDQTQGGSAGSQTGGYGTTQGTQAGTGDNPYQAYLSQWSYSQAPKWSENPPESYKDLYNYDYGQAPQWEGTDYERRRDEALSRAGTPWEGSEYQAKRDAALQRAEDMEWDYDPNTDPVYQAYQKQYRREGQRATQDAMGSYAGMTGGRPSSYAVTAASQAGDYYAAQMADKIPELYNSAYQRYLQEFQRQLGISDQYAGFDDREYNRWADQQDRNLQQADRLQSYGAQEYDRYRDRLGQYNTDRNFRYGVNRDRVSDENNAYQQKYSQYLNDLDQYNTDRNFEYGRYRDSVGDYRYDDETAYNRNYQARRDAINDARYDQEWAQQLKEYADAQGWKQKDWEQYLREYGDQLSEKEKEWAYQTARDAIGDAWNEREYEDSRNDVQWNRDKYEDETAYDRGRDAIEDERYDTKWSAALEDEALDFLESKGYVTGTYASILGVPPGTTREKYYEQYGIPYEQGRYTGPGTTPPPGGNGNKNTIPVDEQGNIDLTGEGLTKSAASGDKGLIHKDGTTMTEGFRQYWPKIRDMYDRGAGEQEIGRYIMRLYDQKVISDHEIEIIMDQLGLDPANSYGGGGSR